MSDTPIVSPRDAELLRLADACIFPGFDGTVLPDWLRRRLGEGLGGVVLFADNVSDLEQLGDLVRDIRGENPSALVAIDEEGGDATRLEAKSGSSWPGNLALGAAGDPGLTHQVAAQVAADLAAAGVNLNLAPVADVNTNPQNPVIGVRSFGTVPRLVAGHTAAFVEGLQSARVAACVKHFPGHGDTEVDSHLDLPTVEGDLAPALEPFRAAVSAGVGAVMTGHLQVPSYGSQPATLNSNIIEGLLRQELDFRGVVLTDALDMHAIAGSAGIAGIARGGVRALAAGADALCLGPSHGEARTAETRSAIATAVQEGYLSRKRLAEAAGRLQRLAAWASPAGGEPGDWSVGLAAARRAVRASGVMPLTSAPYVLQLAPEPNIAVGETPWGVGCALTETFPETVTVRIDEASAPVDDPLTRARGRPLVLAVRDAHRSAWARETVQRVLDARPDTIVVDMGYPSGMAERVESYILTHGASRACGRAAAETLLGVRDATPTLCVQR